MFLSGLDNIDFSGIGVLGGAMSPDAAADLIWNNAIGASAIYSEDEFKALILPSLRSGEYSLVNSPSGPPSGTLSAGDVIGIIDSKRKPGDDPVSGPVQSVIGSIFSRLSNQNYYAVGKQTQQSVPVTPKQSYPSVSQSIAYQGAVAAQQAGTGTQITRSVTSDPVQSFVSSVTSVFSPSGGPSQPPTIFKRVAHRQTPAEKKRLMWIIGIFGVTFAIAIGLIAARNSD